ncbi:MAG: hypothetical protein IKL68_02435 [Clostridia bacterium]|nr:hypothetical protein [Clostridia bacterium]
MKYVVGRIGNMLGGPFKIRYSNAKCIEADSEKEAVDIYNSHTESSISSRTLGPTLAKCIGFMDEKEQLIIPDYHLKYESGKHLRPPQPGTRNHLVSRLLDPPTEITDYSFYVLDFIQAVCPKDALEIYQGLYPSKSFKAYVLGYLDENNNFIVPNILDYMT